MPKECQMELKTEIEKLASNHTIAERGFESQEVADKILKGLLIAG
jgi:hypothetical protein